MSEFKREDMFSKLSAALAASKSNLTILLPPDGYAAWVATWGGSEIIHPSGRRIRVRPMPDALVGAKTESDVGYIVRDDVLEVKL
jgi:hypothetical protein